MMGIRNMPRKQFNETIEKAFKGVESLLNGMLKDRSVPRNIKRVAQRAIEILDKAEETPGILASNIMYLIGDLSMDPNIPFASRTTIYRIIALLENIKD